MTDKNDFIDTNTLIEIIVGLLENMEIDFEQFTIDHFIQRIEAFTGWNIKIIYAPLQTCLNAKVDGFWVRNPNKKIHYVFVNSSISPPQQRNTIFHESGHILQKHPTLAVSNLSQLDLSGVLMRNREEQYKRYDFEAELFSYIVQSLVKRPMSQNRKNVYRLMNEGDS